MKKIRTIQQTTDNPSGLFSQGTAPITYCLCIWQAHQLYGSCKDFCLGLATFMRIHIKSIRQGLHSSMIMPLYTLYANRITV